MSSTGVLTYFIFGTILFFFWIYGIVSFVSDLRSQIIPRIRAHWKDESDEDTEPSATDQLTKFYSDHDDR